MKKAIIFDMDGVIVNTGPIGLEVMRTTVAPYLTTPLSESEIEHYIGAPDREFFAAFVSNRNLEISPQLLLNNQLKHYEAALQTDVHENKEVCELIKNIAPDYKLGVCSGSTSNQINFILKKIELADLFSCTVSCDDVINGKPDPEGYKKALSQLEVNTDEAIIIEDSPVGVKAGMSAGIEVIKYNNGPAGMSTDATYTTNSAADILQLLNNI